MINDQEFERRVLNGLRLEWEHALAHLDPDLRARMALPLFSIRDLKSAWGLWYPSRREIALSRRLISNHSWGSIREVLLHETAHQLAEAIHIQNVSNAGETSVSPASGRLKPPRQRRSRINGERPHGASFQKACSLLGADPRASGNFPAMDERLASKQAFDTDPHLSRVRKLFSLAQSSNRHEAQSAMAKAHEFMAKYNLDSIAGNPEREFASAFLGAPALRHYKEDYALARLIQDFYFVQGIWISAFCAGKNRMGRVLEISGTWENIQLAAYVHDCIRNYTERKWAAYGGNGYGRKDKSDFAYGLIEGFRSALESRAPKKAKAGKALIVVKDPMLENYMRKRYPRTITFQRRNRKNNAQVAEMGERLGRRLVIARGITSKAQGKIFLIAVKR